MERQAVESLRREIAALEKTLSRPAAKTAADREMTARRAIIAEIDELEEKLETCAGCTASDELEDDEDTETGKTASEFAPGIEDEITDDKFSQVEGVAHGRELATEPSMLKTAPTEYVSRWKEASVRLDRVASYLEKSGNTKLAFRIDRIADEIDKQIEEVEAK